jgi:hypothetical protein
MLITLAFLKLKEKTDINHIKHKSILALLLAFMVLLTLGISLVSASGKQAHSQIPLLATVPRTDAFTFCANEGGTCTSSDTFAVRSVRYGANGHYIFKTILNSSIRCSVAGSGSVPGFGIDPIPGTTKECRYVYQPLPPSSTGYTLCGYENMTCAFSGTKLVEYGINGAYYYKLATDGIACTYTAFGGDPYPNVAKECRYVDPAPAPGWTLCATEGGTCAVTPALSGTVAYGANGAYFYHKGIWDPATSTDRTPCNVATFGGDPIYGTVKSCYVHKSSNIVSVYNGFTACGTENATCSFSGTKLVRYGVGARHFYKLATNGIACTYTAFGGDPAPYEYKQCLYANLASLADGWKLCAGEGGQCYTPYNQTLAYGANGSYVYKTSSAASYNTCNATTFGGDPVPGGMKACYMVEDWDSFGWTLCSGESGTCYFLGTKTVAYGANGSYTYMNATGSINCGVAAFGSDPIVGTLKSCYYNRTYGQ